ncbi:MAG: hypothetical protein ACK5N8_01375 [Alphaproteobacteria bacterium]
MTTKNEIYSFQARDGMQIFGDYAENSENQKKKLMIILPGLTGYPQQFVFMSLRDNLVKKGYDVFIANLYSSEEKNGKALRSLLEINMKRHIEDFEDVVEHFKAKYEAIYALGHSLSGRTLLLAQSQTLRKQILLDPAGNYDNPKAQERLDGFYKSLKGTDYKYVDWGDGDFHLCGKTPVELIETPFSIFEKAVKNLKVPTLFLIAGGENIAAGYKEIIQSNAAYEVVKEATHCFTEIGVADKAFSKIFDFLSK